MGGWRELAARPCVVPGVTQAPPLVEFEFGDLGEQVPGRLVGDVGLLGQGLSVHDALLVEQEEHVVACPAQPALVQVLTTRCNICAGQ